MIVSTIRQGESLGLSYGLTPAQNMSAWACRVVIKSTKAGSALIDKTLTDLDGDSENFIGQLTPTETSGLSVGTYWLAAEVSNATTSENAEYHDKLIVTEQAV